MEKQGQFRKIIHVDMDAFYASVEQMDAPELMGKPIAVGGSKERGVVAAASYEARKFGVHSAMSSKRAHQLCPDLIFVKPKFDRYKVISEQIREVFYAYTDLVEPLSLDEAFLDVTKNKKGIPSATLIAKEIKERIKTEVGLTASAGISVNKFLAKIASDYNKPDGLTLIGPEKVHEFLKQLPIKDFFGVGKVTAKKMEDLGIYQGSDLLEWSKEGLYLKFGKSGLYYYDIVRGNDERPVNPHRIRKSLGAERTFDEDLTELPVMLQRLLTIAEEVKRRLDKSRKFGKTLTLKVKFKDFTQITRSITQENQIKRIDEIMLLTETLLGDIEWSKFPEGVRLLGITLSNFEDEAPKSDKPDLQLTLEF